MCCVYDIFGTKLHAKLIDTPLTFLETAHPSKSRNYFSRKLKSYINKIATFYKQVSMLSNALPISYKVTHTSRITKCKEPIQSEKNSFYLLLEMNRMIGESAVFSTLAIMKSKYSSKINVEEEMSSLIPRFEKMCGDQHAHPSHK